MKRLAWVALAMVVAFLGAAFVDRCGFGEGDDCPPACHLACVDGCATAPADSAAPCLTGLERNADRLVEPAAAPLELELPPDLIPPRA